MKTLMLSGLMSVAFLCLVTCNIYARTWYIKFDGTGDAPTIQAGVDSAEGGDTVLVAAGTYTDWSEVLIGGNAKRVNVHLYKNISLIAEEPFHNTILDFTANDCAVYIENTQTAVLKGFKIHLDWGMVEKEWSVYCASGCTIELNRIEYNFYGAAIYIRDDSLDPKVVRSNVLWHNWAGVDCCAPNVTVENNTVFSDTAVEFGVSVFFSTGCGAGLLIRNNILVWGDRAVDCWPACEESAFTIQCNAIYETILDAVRRSSAITLDPSNFEIGPYGDPQFCGAGADNFYLQSDSPCAPGNHPNGYDCGFIGAYPVNCGKVDVEKQSWGSIKSLYRKNDN
jgi:hypothetical protein